MRMNSPEAGRIDAPTQEPGMVRIAAVGDLHYGSEVHGVSRAQVTRLVEEVEAAADILVLCGDLTTHGKPSQATALMEAMGGLRVPTVAVLGNHEFDSGAEKEVAKVLREHGITVLDGEAVEVNGVGFAGVKGFAGGFGKATLGAFGEPIIKAFVQEALDEALKLENALRKLATPVKVAVLHCSPTAETIQGEPLEIQAFLGCSRLMPPLDAMQVDVVFHGHAHTGTLEGRTPGGMPIYNVALPLLQSHGRMFHLWESRARAAALR